MPYKLLLGGVKVTVVVVVGYATVVGYPKPKTKLNHRKTNSHACLLQTDKILTNRKVVYIFNQYTVVRYSKSLDIIQL